MTEKPVTITDVARHARVSKATVSAVINESPVVSHTTRERVWAAIELTQYRPTRSVPRATRERSIALLVKELDNPYYTEIVLGARAKVAERGYTLLVVSSEGEYDAERRAVAMLREKGVDGLIVTPVLDEHADLSHLFELKRRNFPFVLLERIIGVPGSIVDVDNVEASRRAVEHLFALGHTRVVHFAGPTYSMHSRERLDGVRRAFSATALCFPEDGAVPAGAHFDSGYRAARELFGARGPAERPTGVTCYNDLVALGVMRALADLGLRVPQDVSVIGYDDLPILRCLPVPLTTVRVPLAHMGEIAAEILTRQIESRDASSPEKVVLDAELMVRGSTGPAASRG